MGTVAESLRAAIRACSGITDPTPLERAAALLAEPWTVAVVGRVAAGKSSLVARLAGTPRAVGLGGVTRALERVPSPCGVLLDTPGIDDPDTALLGLDPVLDDADAVIWVTDGLQPLTASEREVVAATLPPGRPLWIVVSKADLLDPAEVPSVLDRVRDLAGRHAPREVVALDVRRPAPPDALGRVPLPGPRRAAAVRAALRTVRAALPPVPPGPDELARVWRDAVREATRAVDEAITAGAVSDRAGALAALAARAPVAHEAVRTAAGSVVPPPLPVPALPQASLGDWIDGYAAGATGARKALRSEGARWLAEGEVALAEGWPGAAVLRASRARRLRLEEALDAVGRGLPQEV